jgi:O-succinylbenzoic acid--CoA ligase
VDALRQKSRSASGDDEAPDWLRWRAETSPLSLAVKCGGLEWSYAELDRRAGSLAAALRELRVRRRDRVAVLLPASETYLALIHAAARIGAVVVPLNHRLSAQELLVQVKDADAAAVVFEESLGKRARLDAGGTIRGRWIEVSELSASSGPLEPIAGGRLDLKGPHAIIYTSGSSGSPKGVVLSLSNLMWNSVSLGFSVGASPRDRWLLCLPLFHVGGYAIVFRALLAGSGIVLHPRFEPERVLLSLRDDRVTLASFVPTMLTDVLNLRGAANAPDLRLILVGGGKPTPDLKALVEKHGLPVTLTYGMTETCSFVALSRDWSSAEQEYLPCFPNEVRLVEISGDRLRFAAAPGDAGEIAVRGPATFFGYWRRPALTRSRFVDGWFLTGDLGVLDGSGAIRVIGRKDATIVTGGEKVFPDEVESVLRSHPSIAEAVVVGIEDKRWGQMVVAVVEPKDPGRPPSDAELKSFLSQRLGRYKIPKRYVFEDHIQRTSTGKPRRAEVLEALQKKKEEEDSGD